MYKLCISSGANNDASVVVVGATSSIDIAGKLFTIFKSGIAYVQKKSIKLYIFIKQNNNFTSMILRKYKIYKILYKFRKITSIIYTFQSTLECQSTDIGRYLVEL
jgi:hypothetical protein